jgi:hypothetical protein
MLGQALMRKRSIIRAIHEAQSRCGRIVSHFRICEILNRLLLDQSIEEKSSTVIVHPPEYPICRHEQWVSVIPGAVLHIAGSFEFYARNTVVHQIAGRYEIAESPKYDTRKIWP